MSMEEVWKIKEQISQEIKGKDTNELKAYFKSAVDEFNAEIKEIRLKKKSL